MPPKAYEINFDGLVGPTHNYAGLSQGNLASQRSKHDVSNPRAAALEGLAKMKVLADLGVRQAVLPPHERPDVGALRRMGFSGSDADVLWKARRADPVLLATCCSASAMWAANAATVSPSSDCADGRVHFTPANLVSQPHRSLEPPTTAAALRAIFSNAEHFAHHPPLPCATAFGDEGAANDVRLAPSHEQAGVELFVYGRSALDSNVPAPARFPARQTREASQAVARLHALAPERLALAQQNPAAIDRGVFHNDVVCVGNENVLLYHEEAFAEGDRVVAELATKLAAAGAELVAIKVPASALSLEDAVKTYLFNSQIVTLPDGSMSLIAPAECVEHAGVRAVIDEWVLGGRIRSVNYVSVRQSMSNGGGPACLRLRVVLTEQEMAAMHPGALFEDALYAALTEWVKRHYRERLSADDLAAPALLEEGRAALDELTGLLGLPGIYAFQRSGGTIS